MLKKASAALLFGCVLTSVATAQPPNWRFRWRPGQVLNYRVEQATSASEVVDGKKTETATKLNNMKCWQVLEVDASGVATMQLTLTALRLETTTPSGEAIVFDSSEPAKSNPQMREQLAKYVGQPLMVLRVDSLGKVVEVKDCKFGSPSRLESEPPFGVVLPSNNASDGSWTRAYQVTLEPPHGTGEKYDMVQQYALKSSAIKPVNNVPLATISLRTEVKTQPEAVADRAPLLQSQPEGEVVLNVQSGMMESVRLRIDKELKDHQGEGSSYRFQSTYSEQYVGDGKK
jgi:hypothetical protein